jgi:uncharacterized membrane protein
MALVGRLHPLLVHFPIGLILAAAAAELAAIHTGRADWRAIAAANVRAGAATGALTAVAGWGLASSPLVQPSRLLAWHGWMGAAGAVGAIGAAVLSIGAGDPTRRRRRLAYRAALFGAAALVAVAGHLGGTLVWSADAAGLDLTDLVSFVRESR